MRLITLLQMALAAPLIVPAQAAERPRAKIECTPTAQKLVYDCMIQLTGRKSGTALDGVEFEGRNLKVNEARERGSGGGGGHRGGGRRSW